jgi:hypothetical protein
MSALARTAGIALVVALGYVLVAGLGETGGPVALILPLGILALGVILFRRPRALVDLGWAGRGPAHGSPSAAVTTETPAETPPIAVPKPPATRQQVAAALARVEAREWLASPWFAAGIGFCLLLTVLFGFVWARSVDGLEGSWRFWFVHLPVMAHPMVGMAVVTAHRAVTRARRDGAEEMFEACPTDQAARTTAHLWCAWVPALAIAVFAVVITLLMSTRNNRIYGPIDARALADVLTAIGLGACGAWLGVALGRWAPWRLVPMVSVAALLPFVAGLGNLGEPHWSNLRQLSSWPRYPEHDLLFTDPPVWWHLLWLLSLGALMAVISIARERRDRRVLVAGAAVAVVAVVAGVAETRPLSRPAAARLASLVAEPERHQTCGEAAWLRACVYRGYQGSLDLVLANLRPVAAAAPATTPVVTFRQGFDGELDLLGPEVNRAIGGRPVADPDTLRLGYGTSDGDMAAIRLRTALAAVGLPVVPPPGGVPELVAGQARGVVALWLAARGLEPAAAGKLASHHWNPDDHPGERPTAFHYGMAWPDQCDAGLPPVAWAPQDLAAARALLALPADRVQALLLGAWERFTDPATSTDDLLAAAGLPGVGPPDQVVPVYDPCPY